MTTETAAAAFNLTARFEQRIASLTGQLERISRRFKGTMSEHDAEDIFQAMVLHLLEKAHKDPTFLDQNDGYLINAARWHGQNVARNGRVYTKNVPGYVADEDIADDQDNDNGEQVTLSPAHSHRSAERDYIELEAVQAIEAAMDAIGDEKNNVICKMLVNEEPYAAIVVKTGISKGAISQRRTTITNSLRPTLQAAGVL